MKPSELFNYCKAQNILVDEMTHSGHSGIAFRDESLPYFRNNAEACEFIPFSVLHRMTLDEFKRDLFKGLRVEGITRVTGYFSKVSHWNKGKLGELQDRVRHDL